MINTRKSVAALLAITFLYPVILCGVFFPTPAGDLREHINLGLTFPLHTWPNPPLQTWIAGAVALTGARDSWFFVLVAQVLNFIGLIFLIRTAKEFIGRDKVVPLILMFCGSLYYSAATPSMALNADQIQVPIAAALIYYALRAVRDNRLQDWLACGALAGLAVLAKYSSAVLIFAMLASAISIPAFRKIFSNPKLYVAGALAASIAMLNIVPEFVRPDAVDYAVSQFDVTRSLEWRADAPWHIVRSVVFYGYAIVVSLIVLAWRGGIRTGWPREQSQEFIVRTAVGIIFILVILIIVGGLNYSTRHSFPFFGIWMLALIVVFEIRPQELRRFVFLIAGFWSILLTGSLIYSQVAINRVLREPSPEAARALRLIWDRQFSCGPAYIVGEQLAERGIAINFGRRTIGIAQDELGRPDWFDRDQLRRYGAIVVTTPDGETSSVLISLISGIPGSVLSLPYRRTWRTETQTYTYYLVSPGGCRIRPAD